MDKRYSIVDESDNIVRPLSVRNIVEIVTERKVDDNLLKIRDKLSGPLLLDGDDYKYFELFERRNSTLCQKFILARDLKCNGLWVRQWTGKFSAGSGSWDHANCQWRPQPEPIDEYECIDLSLNKPFNVLDLDDSTVTIDIPSTFQFDIISEDDLFGVPPEDFILGEAFDYTGFTWLDEESGCNLYLFWQEYCETVCSGGSPVAPSSGGWSLLTNLCSTQGFAKYVRPASVPYTFGTPVRGTFDPEPTHVVPPDNSCNWIWIDTNSGWCDGYTANVPFFICGPLPVIIAHTMSFGRTRSFAEVAEALFSQCGLTVVSNFFEINPVNDDAEYTPGDNYVTGETNQVANIRLVEASDAFNNSSTNPATKGDLPMRDFLNLLSLWRCLAVVEGDTIRIEHISYWNRVEQSNTISAALHEPRRYKYLNEDRPNAEYTKWALNPSVSGRDFEGAPIFYDLECVSSEAKKIEHDFSPVVNDLGYVLTVQGIEGRRVGRFLILACDLSNHVIADTGALSGLAIINAPMACANLQDKYWRHDRLARSGTMNDRETTFDDVTYTVEQEDVWMQGCCEALDVDPRKTIVTDLAARMRGNGVIHTQRFNPKTGVLTMTLRYRR